MQNQKPLGLVKRIGVSAKAAYDAFGGSEVGYGEGSVSSRNATARLVGGTPLAEMRLSTDSFYTIWRNHSDVFSAVKRIADSIGVAGWKWTNKQDPEKDPNPASIALVEGVLTYYSSMRSWLRQMVTDVNICGNAYYHLERSKTGKFIGLNRVDPRTMIAVTDKAGTLLRWIQRAGADTMIFQPDEIVHFYLLRDPNSPVYGISPMEPVLWDIRSDLAGVVSNYALFENDAVPAAIYVFEDEMSDEEMELAIAKLQEQIKGAHNRHKSLAMKGLKEIKTVSITNRDMEFPTLRKITTEKVCATYGVPKGMLGYTDAINLANGKEQSSIFWSGTMETWEEQVTESIMRILLKRLNIDDIKFEFNIRDFDNREWDESSSRADVQLGIMTINEARVQRKLEKFDEAEHGEFVNSPLIFNGASVKPVGDVGIDPVEDLNGGVMDEAANEKALSRLDALGQAYVSKNPRG